MEFLPLSRRRSSSQNVPSGEERGETDVFAGWGSQLLKKKKIFFNFFLSVLSRALYYYYKLSFGTIVNFFARVTKITCQYMTYRTFAGQQPDFRLKFVFL